MTRFSLRDITLLKLLVDRLLTQQKSDLLVDRLYRVISKCVCIFKDMNLCNEMSKTIFFANVLDILVFEL